MKTVNFILVGQDSKRNAKEIVLTIESGSEMTTRFLVENLHYRLFLLSKLPAFRMLKKSDNLKCIIETENGNIDTAKLSTQLAVNLKSGKNRIDSGKFKESLYTLFEASAILSDSTDYSR